VPTWLSPTTYQREDGSTIEVPPELAGEFGAPTAVDLGALGVPGRTAVVPQAAPEPTTSPSGQPLQPPKPAQPRLSSVSVSPPVDQDMLDRRTAGGMSSKTQARGEANAAAIGQPLEDSYQVQDEARVQGIDLDQQAAKATYANAKDVAADADSFRRAETEIMAKNAVARDERLAQIDQALARAQAEVKPNELWQGATRAQQFGGMLGIIMSGLVSPKFGGKNGALELVNQAIERNVSAQIENIKNAKEDARLRMASYNLLVDKQDLDGKGRNQLYLMGLDSAAKELQARIAEIGASDQAAQQAGLETLGALMEERALKMEEIRQQAMKESMDQTSLEIQEWSARRQAAQASARLAFDKEEADKGREERAAATKPGDPGIEIRTGEGEQTYGLLRDDVASSPELKYKVQKQFADFGNAQDTLTRAIKLVDGYGGSRDLLDVANLSKSGKAQEIDQVLTQLAYELASAQNGGRMTEQDVQGAAKQIGADLRVNFGSMDARERLRDYGKAQLDKAAREANTWLKDQTVVGYRDPSGQVRTRTAMEDVVARRTESWKPAKKADIDDQMTKARKLGEDKSVQSFSRPMVGPDGETAGNATDQVPGVIEEFAPVAKDLYYYGLRNPDNLPEVIQAMKNIPAYARVEAFKGSTDTADPIGDPLTALVERANRPKPKTKSSILPNPVQGITK
jgi:hypothetical protein